MFTTKKFHPVELFDLLWTTPVSTVARQIGISDVGLAKACRKAGIVLPTRGHWAKREGRRPKKPKPPSSTETIEFRIVAPHTLNARPSGSAPSMPSIQISVPLELSDPHPLVQRWLSAARKAKTVEGYLSFTAGGLLDAKISKSTIDRCALLYDTLLKEGEALGFAWTASAGQTQVTVAGEILGISIEERVTRVELPRPAHKALKPGEAWKPDFSALRAPRYTWEATGELSLHVYAQTIGRERKNWKDTQTGRLEIKLGKILTALPGLAAGAKLLREKCEARELEWKLEGKLRQERLALSARTRKLRSALVANVVDWERAQRLEAFIQATIASAPGDEQTQEELGLWAAWARRQVKLLDPLNQGTERVWRMSTDIDPHAYQGPMYGAPKDPNSWWE